jgi:hypothetical protein
MENRLLVRIEAINVFVTWIVITEILREYTTHVIYVMQLEFNKLSSGV